MEDAFWVLSKCFRKLRRPQQGFHLRWINLLYSRQQTCQPLLYRERFYYRRIPDHRTTQHLQPHLCETRSFQYHATRTMCVVKVVFLTWKDVEIKTETSRYNYHTCYKAKKYHSMKSFTRGTITPVPLPENSCIPFLKFVNWSSMCEIKSEWWNSKNIHM